MINALWANSNYDDDKGTRKQAIEEIEENFNEAMAIVRGEGPMEEEIDPDNPFFKPAIAAKREAEEKIEDPRNSNGRVKDAVDYSKFIDQ